MRSLTIVLGALTAFALGACKVESTTTGTGGSTSATGSTGEGGAGGVATGGGGNASTGTVMCDPAYTCSQAITSPDGDPAELCDGPSKKLFDALSGCLCTGACATDCADSACKQLDPSTECKACMSNSMTGCGNEFVACANDA